MHIAFLTPEYPNERTGKSGGLGTSIRNLAKGLVAHNIQVTVFILGQQKDIEFREEGVQLVCIAKQNYLAFNWYLQRKRYQKIIQNYVDEQEVQLIEAPDWTGISAFMKFNVPLIIRLHGSDGYFCHLDGRRQKWKNRFLEQIALKNADAIVSVSTYTGNLTKEIFGSNKTIRTIPNGINTDDFKPLDIDFIEGQLLYFGTLIRKKGVLELAEIFNKVVEKVPQCHLMLIGKDVVDLFEKTSTLSLFKALLSPEAKKRINYIEEVPYDKVQEYIAKAQIVVLPSFAEAFPMTWLETLAMEKALVSSNIGWASELMVDGVTGYTVQPKNHQLYAERIIELLRDIDKCARCGSAGREHVLAKFSIDIIVRKNIAFYKEMIKS